MKANEQYEELEIVRYTPDDGLFGVDDRVVRESSVRIFLNDREVVSLQALKHEVADLAIGFLFTECLISNIDAVKDIRVSDGLDAVTVFTDEEVPQNMVGTVRSVTSGCGSGVSFINPMHHHLFKPVEAERTLPAERVPELMRLLLKSSELFELTGGVHTAALSDGENLVHVADDVGRHNCVDRIIGRELVSKSVEPGRRVILTSGRLSSDIVAKSIRGRVPIVVSHSAPTMGGVQLAKKFGITLVGFVRGKRFNVYANEERIIL